MELRSKQSPVQKHADGGQVDAITTPMQLGSAIKKVFKNKYGIEVSTKYIKTVRGLDNSYYEVHTFKPNGITTIPNEARKELLELSHNKPISEIGVSDPNNISYGNISMARISVHGKDWKRWLKSQLQYFEEGGNVGSSMTEKEVIDQYAWSSSFPTEVSNSFEIVRKSISNDTKAKEFIEELKRNGFTVKKKTNSDFTAIFAVKRKFEEGGKVGCGCHHFEQGGTIKDDAHLDDLYIKGGKNVFGALQLYAGELGIFNMYYGHKVDSAKKAKYKKAQEYLERKYMGRKFEDGGIVPAGVMTYTDFKAQMPPVKSPYVGEEHIIFKPAYDQYSDRRVYFKAGRKGSQKLPTDVAYKGYLYDNFNIDFDRLSPEEKEKLTKRKPIATTFKQGGTISGRSFRYLQLIPEQNGLTIKLTKEGKEKVADDDISYDNFWEYFDDVQGNSDYLYIDDVGNAGLGMSNAPAITDSYYYDDDGKLTDEDHGAYSKLYPFMDYQIVDFTDKLKENGEVFFPEFKKHQLGGTTRSRTFVPKHTRTLKLTK